MIYLCAQPDDFYFTWQLDLLVYNYHSLGIKPEDIHILIGYNPKYGLKYFFKELIERNQNKARFFIYPDKRKTKNYVPSIRPHIIAQHLAAHLNLQNEDIFYHDSDIIFTALPDFKQMQDDDIWYVSDTREYLDSNYIKLVSDEAFFKEMCKTIGVSSKLIEDNDPNCGGAQYFLKKTTVEFWDKVERDTEKLYVLMENYNTKRYLLSYQRKPLKRSQYKGGIQSWCADMWVIFWNAYVFGREVSIHKELDFMIAKSETKELEEKKILHYSGDAIQAVGPVFRKGKYSMFSPFYEANLVKITDETVSNYLIAYFNKFKCSLEESRINLSDVTFIIPVKIDSQSRLDNLYAIVGYLSKFFNTRILIGEIDATSQVDKSLLPDCCTYRFYESNDELMHRTKLNNTLIKEVKTPIIAIYDTDVVFPISQIVESVSEIRNGAAIVSPYSGNFRSVTNLFKPIFSQILDPSFLEMNASVFNLASKRSYGGAVFLNREIYTMAGLDNEFFTRWGPEDIERVKRMQILGYRTKRIKGDLYHLPHERKINSRYDEGIYELFIEEYLKIASLNSDELKKYINTWSSNYNRQYA